ncbi:MAG TPA: flagellar basal-body MS-ring/collar protein FliF [Steroidobacteraceae bacterium]|nr:flagellar basal-body MS-ring/collar protein FliF [Steroidobacteraceae bacterium]HQX47060.1 flagellar basal-body MS-ring/collar protein FliF [Steroidobacteraceae bacterium]HQZ79677.1 flagellar basal-body MS-ring/collar protein FliF [Steroidobacteraceae bacterium]
MNADVEQLPIFARVATGLRPVLLLAGIAAAVAAGLGIVFWAKGPSYSLLYSSLAAGDLVEVQQTLQAAGIEHTADVERGTVSVPAQRLNDARLALAAQGVLQSTDGFSAMAKDSGFGVSQFMEGARYQHALETELARTIASLQPVAAARVHIAAPRQSAFVRDRRNATASVFVQLKTGRRLESAQVTAIVNLVASSIAELKAEDVTVVDQAGRLLSQPGRDGDLAAREQQFEFARSLESEYAQRIETLLAPVVGEGRVRAQVVASVDMSVTEEAREQYRPESQVVRSEQLAEETARTGGGPNGVPGALSNQPPVPGTALPPGQGAVAPVANADAAAAAAAQGSSSKQSTRNYEIDRTVAYTRQPAGRLKRLTVAVLVDDIVVPTPGGKTIERPLGAEQLARITTLVKDAVGFDAARGDSVNVVNASFNAQTAEPVGALDPLPIWQQPWIRELAKILAGAAIVIVLLLSIVRPLVRSLTGPRRLAAALIPALPGAPAQGAVPHDEAQRAPGQVSAIAYEQQIAQARSLVTQDPKRVARVVRTWVGKDD